MSRQPYVAPWRLFDWWAFTWLKVPRWWSKCLICHWCGRWDALITNGTRCAGTPNWNIKQTVIIGTSQSWLVVCLPVKPAEYLCRGLPSCITNSWTRPQWASLIWFYPIILVRSPHIYQLPNKSVQNMDMCYWEWFSINSVEQFRSNSTALCCSCT